MVMTSMCSEITDPQDHYLVIELWYVYSKLIIVLTSNH